MSAAPDLFALDDADAFELFGYQREAANDNADAQRDADVEAAWREGELWWKLDPHQLEVYKLFHEWNERRLTTEYGDLCAQLEGALDDVWQEELARRFGKTAKWIVMLTELAIKREGAVFTYATAYQKDIGEIIVPLSNLLLSDGPEELRPRYRGSHGESHEGLYIDAPGSVIKLVGIDKHPDALRGRFSDGVVISEAGFVKGLEDTVRAVLLPQFQRRPWAFLALESSTPKQPDHDFTRVFRPDAQARGAYVMRTLDDNKAIDEREKAKAIRQAGGRGHPTCEREYYCEETRDPEQIVVPEFDEKNHVREVERPQYVHCYTAADPGSRDMFGLVFGYWDFVNARGVFEASWARRNPSTRQAACVIALYEWKLWGKWPSDKMHDIPLRESRGKLGWRELLAGDATPEECEQLYEMARSEKQPAGDWRGPPPAEHCTYWDGRKFKQNPFLRVTDVDHRLIHDLSGDYGISFENTAKDDADAQRNNFRDGVGAGKILFLPSAGPVIQHVKNAIWNDKRTDYERSKVYGHYDCLAGGVYWWRNVLRERSANPPEHVFKDPHHAHVHAFEREKEKSDVAKAVERAFGGGNRWQQRKQGWRR